jgi:hypothetical protein
VNDHDAAVEVAIATFLALPEATDDELVATLGRTGVEPWLATRLVPFLPLAFGRRLLPGARLSEEFNHAGTRRRLDEDAVYGAAEARALTAVRHELATIGLRSAEVQAVNAAYADNAAFRVEGATFSPLDITHELPPSSSRSSGFAAAPCARLSIRGIEASSSVVVTNADDSPQRTKVLPRSWRSDWTPHAPVKRGSCA